MSKNASQLDTYKLMVYSEVFTKMSEQITTAGQAIYKNNQWGGIAKSDCDKVLQTLALQQDKIEQKRIELVKELTKRIKHDTGINRGPGDLDVLFDKFMTDYPVLKLGEAEIKAAIQKGIKLEREKKDADKLGKIIPKNKKPPRKKAVLTKK